MTDMHSEGPVGKGIFGWLRDRMEQEPRNEFVVFAENIRNNAMKDSSWPELVQALPDEVVEQFKKEHPGLSSKELSSKELAASVALSELWDAKSKDQMGDVPVDIKGITASYFDTLGDSARPLESIKALPLTEFTQFRADRGDVFSVLAAWKAMLPK